MLYSNSLKAQYQKINIFFQKEKLHAYNYCRNELKTDQDYLHVKKIKDTMLIKLLEGECSAIASNYDLFKTNTVKLLNLNDYDKKKNFIIINKNIKTNRKPTPVLTVLKFEKNDKYYAIHNYEAYYDIKQDSLMAGYKPEKEFQILENYFYNKRTENKIFENFNDAQTYSNDFSTYYIVARISGKMITKKIYFANESH